MMRFILQTLDTVLINHQFIFFKRHGRTKVVGRNGLFHVGFGVLVVSTRFISAIGIILKRGGRICSIIEDGIEERINNGVIIGRIGKIRIIEERIRSKTVS